MSDRPCTCHPDDNPPVPCAKRYALTECKAAAYEALRSRLAAQENAARQADERGDEAMRRAHAAEARLAEAERDRDAGWKAFYALREQVGKDRYPGLTNIVRTTDSATVIVQDKLASTLNPHPMLSPTHRCTSCGALWRQCDDFSMNLRSPTCCDACNNAPCAAGLIPLVVAEALLELMAPLAYAQWKAAHLEGKS